MKIEIKYSKDGKTFIILKDDKEVVSCDSSVDPNYALESFGLATTSVAVIDLTKKVSEVDIDKIIENIKFDTPNLVDTNRALSSLGGINLSKDDKDVLADPEFTENDIEGLPIKLKQKVYVDDIQGGLCTLVGGLATINMLWMDASENTVQTGTEFRERDFDDDDDDEDFIDESEEIEIREKQVMFAIEEAPGMFFSWSLLKEDQERLKIKFGQTPAELSYPVGKA